MKAHQLINQDSGDTEYYTPVEIVEAARQAMGNLIGLDPASSAIANERIGALAYFDGVERDGLKMPWYGTVWLNHPFSRAGNPLWVAKAVGEYRAGRVRALCCITFAATSERWFAPLMDYPQCFLQPRTNYYLPDGTLKRGVTKGSVVTYLGPDVDAFRTAFAGLGKVKM